MNTIIEFTKNHLDKLFRQAIATDIDDRNIYGEERVEFNFNIDQGYDDEEIVKQIENELDKDATKFSYRLESLVIRVCAEWYDFEGVLIRNHLTPETLNQPPKERVPIELTDFMLNHINIICNGTPLSLEEKKQLDIKLYNNC